MGTLSKKEIFNTMRREMLEFNLFEKPMLEEDILYKEAMLETAKEGQERLRKLTRKGVSKESPYNQESKNIIREDSKSPEYDGSEYGGLSGAWCR